MPHAKNRHSEKQARELFDWLNEHIEEKPSRISLGVIDTENGPLERHLRQVTDKAGLMECFLPMMLSKGAR